MGESEGLKENNAIYILSQYPFRNPFQPQTLLLIL
jgi:hypothetical protein